LNYSKHFNKDYHLSELSNILVLLIILYFCYSESQIEQNNIFNIIKQVYKRQNLITRIINPSKSFPIEQNYINLSIIKTKEQQLKENKLLDIKQNNEIIGTYEEIYGTKINIEIKDIFQKCNNEIKNILVIGRAGIGKTTFCRYVAYQWAIGTIWQQYDLILFIRLHNLTESRYPSLTTGIQYSLTDLIKTEYFQHGLSEKDEKLLKEQFDKSQVLWLLDGYDEIVQNIPPHRCEN
jgi:predicted NACHT family NTPase